MPRLIFFLILLTGCFILQRHDARAGETTARPQASLQSYTGIWDMPNARVLPDWHARFKLGRSAPYTYYGGALGAFDLFEAHGQFTEVDTIIAFEGFGYGNYKDRSAGVRMVLLKESSALPQVAAGVFDPTGTALFGTRYLVVSKMFGNVDFTFGLGQGILAGEFIGGSSSAVVGSEADTGLSFLFSNPLRATKPFAGLEWYITPNLTFSAEYSSIDNSKMVGFVDESGKNRIKADDSIVPVNLGLKYNFTKAAYAQLGLAGGNTVFFGLGVDFDLAPGSLLGWKKRPAYRSTERIRQEIAAGSTETAARRIADVLYADGFSNVLVSLGADAIWVETETGDYLSDARALARIGQILDEILPPSIHTLYLTIQYRQQRLTSWQVNRADFTDFRNSTIDKETLLAVSRLNLYPDRNERDFLSGNPSAVRADSDDKWYDFSSSPKARTFLNNRSGFFKHKILLRNQLSIVPWRRGLFAAALEIPLFNQYDELIYDPLERDAARTDVKLYAQRTNPHLTQLAFNQIFELPHSIYARASAGAFEAAYAGFGGEIFRYFNHGLWGVGIEAETVRKRDLDNDFKLSETDKIWRTPAYVNLYSQLWPSQGIEAGLKIGRFLAGDVGASIELRRTFQYFTLGAWFTKTDTSVFKSEKNIGTAEKGVFITFPLAFFSDKESKRRSSYAITSFTRDQGQTVAQPGFLYPINPFGTPVFVKQNLDEMRN
jgi:Exopolysaccharide biosynthesis protein YbjH